MNAEFYNYQNVKVRLPDLVFYLAGEPRHGVVDSLYDGLFVECKIIDAPKSKDVGKYCTKGLFRFVIGDYGWRMPQGMMCAYVRDSHMIPKALDDYFLKTEAAKALNLIDRRLARSTLNSFSPHVYVSRHDRSWTFSDGTPPGEIAVRHMWLQV